MATINPMAQMLRGSSPNMGAIARDTAPTAQDIAFRQQIAQMLLQQSQQQPQAQMVGGRYIPPNPGQVLSNAFSGISGYSMMNDANKQQADLLRQQDQQQAAMFGLGGQDGAQQSQGMQQPGMSPQSVAPQVSQPSVPLLPGMSAEQSFTIARNIGMPAYMKLAVEQGAPTDVQRNLMAAGLQPGTPEFQRALQMNVNRPINVAPGGTMIDPVTGRPMFSAPQDGMQTMYGPGGQASVSAVPGYSQVQAQNAGAVTGAQEAARAQFDIVEIPDGQGGTIRMPRSEAAAALARQSGSQPGQLGRTPSNLERNANRAIDLIGRAKEILPNASSGVLSGLATSGQEALGISTPASQADAQLKAISGQLISMMPRMEGPQSDRDVQMYQQMAGDLANPNLPIQTRLAAADTIIGLQEKYATDKPGAQTAQQAQQTDAYPRVGSAQDFQRLRSGSLFYAPDGSLRRKP